MPEFDPIRSRQAGYNYVGNVLDERDRRQAGGLYASGDMAGAQSALARSGNIDGAMTLQRQQTAAAETARTQAKAQQDQDNAWLVRGMTGLRGVPADQRRTVYQTQIRPLLQQNGFDDAELAQIDAADLSDAELDAGIRALGGEVAGRQTFNTRQGIVERDPYSGGYNLGYALPADPNLALEQELMQARIDATRAQVGQREAAAAKSARGPAPRGGGSSGGGSQSAPAAPMARGVIGSSLPPGFTIRRR